MRALVALALGGCGFTVAGTGTDGAALPMDSAPIDVPAPTSCTNGQRDGDEMGIDCGGSCPVSCDALFVPDANTLAAFELNGDVIDTSGNHRDAIKLGGTFVATAWGQGLNMPDSATEGFDWSAYAALLVHPYTIEIVVTPRSVACWGKLFSPDDAQDTGWNYCDRFQTYPGNYVGPTLIANQRHYFAIVSTSTNAIDVYLNGTKLGNLDASFTAPPGDAVFFRDDTQTGRGEALDGVVDAVRISKVTRSAAEITAVQARIILRP